MRQFCLATMIVAFFVVRASAADADPRFVRPLAAGHYIATFEVDQPPKSIDGISATTQTTLPRWTDGDSIVAAIDLVVEKPQASGQTVHATYVRLRHTYQLGQHKLVTDTDGPPRDDFVWPEYKAMTGVPFAVVFDTAGVPQRVSGMDRIWQKLADGPAKDLPTEVDNMRRKYGEQWVKSILGVIKQDLPDGPVKVGQPWKNVRQIHLPIFSGLEPMAENVTSTPTRIETAGTDRIADVTISGSISKTYDMSKRPKAAKDDLPFTRAAIEGKSDGRMRWDLTNGMPLERVVNSELRVHLTTRSDTGGEESHTLDMTTKIAIRLTRADAAPTTQTARPPRSKG